jgi:hypothetical protein
MFLPSTDEKDSAKSRIVDLHGFNADPDPSFFLIADPDSVPDPGFY